MAVVVMLVAALATLVLTLKKRARPLDAIYAFAALGLIVFFGEAAMGAGSIDHTIVLRLYLAAAASIAGVFLIRRESFSYLFSLTPVLATAYVFAPANYWRSPLTLAFFIWCVSAAIGFVRGAESAPVVDARYPGRLPLRRPPRLRGAREIACAGVASAFAVVFGAALFWPAPPPAETPVAQEESASPETVAPPSESDEVKEAPAQEPASYTARAGDTFRAIAKRLYGDVSKAGDIARVNPDVKPKTKLRAGQKINLPAPAKKAGD